MSFGKNSVERGGKLYRPSLLACSFIPSSSPSILVETTTVPLPSTHRSPSVPGSPKNRSTREVSPAFGVAPMTAFIASLSSCSVSVPDSLTSAWEKMYIYRESLTTPDNPAWNIACFRQSISRPSAVFSELECCLLQELRNCHLANENIYYFVLHVVAELP